MAAKCAEQQSSSEVKIVSEYISVACNRTPQSAKWSPEGDELIYGAGKSLAVTSFDCSAPVVRCTLSLHKDRVNCVHFIQFRDSQGGSDGELGPCICECYSHAHARTHCTSHVTISS